MATIQIKNLAFTYEGAAEPVFCGLSFNMDSSWRLGLVGRNGRGKTTLLKLLAGQLTGSGQVVCPLPCEFFPFQVEGARPALEALIDALAPYTRWEREMAACLDLGTPAALQRFGEVELAYAAQEGYTIREALAREAAQMRVDPEALGRPFASFSPGEQARLKLAARFVRPGHFLLIDEPTNHLDQAGRQVVADYLGRKAGFLTASHDRSFLDQVCDHILALEKQGARLVAGNYSSYRENKRLQDDHERAQRDRILADVSRLRVSAGEKAAWSDRVEAGKTGGGPVDRGYIGARSAAMMKRAKAMEGRVQKQIEQKEALLKNLEYTSPLKLRPLPHPAPLLLRFEDVGIGFTGQPLFEGLSFTLAPGERLAVLGPNGAGKSTLLRLILGQLRPDAGRVWTPGGLVISHLPQTAEGLTGTPRALALREGLDLTLFLTILRKFDLPQAHFDREVAGFSLGQKKKVLLARSLARPAHLYLWDEPLNDIDPESREQLEELLADTSASLVFIEHERLFISRVATRELVLGQPGGL
ncbi:MAG: ABC-F family ATP-binding cassette domain-containing protein [Clostridiales bacterium]|nr:ABC-F family ATP-binding cassette domain-containing protein [Clostridiales bacterium]